MPVPRLIDRLPPDFKRWFEAEVRRRGFGDYEALTAEVHQRLAVMGVADRPSWQTVAAWGAAIKADVAKYRAMAAVTAAILEAVPPGSAADTAQVGTLIQHHVVAEIAELGEAVQIEDPAKRIEALVKLQDANTRRQKLGLDQRRSDLEQEKAELDRARLAVAKDQAALAREKWEAEQQIRAEERAKAAAAAEGAARSQGVSPEGIVLLREAIMGAL